MQIISDLEEWMKIRQSFPSNTRIGFVPTMGNLHLGHTSLMQKSQHENKLTVVSIFVNPTQFNNPEDFIRYPRTLSSDKTLLQELNIDYCIIPEKKDLYIDNFQYQIEEKKLTQLMEGQYRPGHFTGVLTIVMKLLNLVKPNCLYLGEKDYQQYLLIKDMVNAFFLGIQVKACPTVRELSGLAYSSRNNRLNKEQRILAEKFAQIFHQKLSIDQIKQELMTLGIKVEYLEEHYNRRFTSILIDDIRLIDNYALN